MLNIMRVFRKMELNARYKRWIKKMDDPRAREILRTDSKKLEDVLYLSAFHFKETNTDPFHPKLKPLWDRYFKDLSEVQTLLNERGVRLVFVIYPSVATLFDYGKNNYQEILIQFLKHAGIPYVDMRQRLLSERGDFLKLYNDLPRDFHLSPYSKKIMAQEVYETVTHQAAKK